MKKRGEKLIVYTHFQYCPRCGTRGLEGRGENGVCCYKCGYVYFHNCASAVAAIIETPGGILLARRGASPKKGYFDLPGGFVDYGESLEDALKREIREEINLDITALKYFASFPNIYHYKKVTYFTTDAFFICKPKHSKSPMPGKEISAIVAVPPQKIDLTKIAFTSTKEALRKYRRIN